MEKRIYTSFSCLKEATSTKIEIYGLTVEEISERVQRNQDAAIARHARKYPQEWYDQMVYAKFTFDGKVWHGIWVREGQYIVAKMQKLDYSQNIILRYMTRGDYFNYLRQLNGK